MDAIVTQVVFNRFRSAAEEMWATLVKAAYSVNIKERHDCSAAVFSAAGEVVAMPSRALVPIHLSSLDGVVQAVLLRFPFEHLRPGDMFIANDPYIAGGGGSHLPDYTVVAPVFGRSGRVVAFVANLGHHSDIGGAAAGSHAVHMPSIFHEGLRLPVVRIVRGGEIQEDVVDLICLNSRLPDERQGDLRAQFAANTVGIRGLHEACDRFGEETIRACMADILDYSEHRLRSALRRLPDATVECADYFDDDGIADHPLRIQVRAVKRGDGLTFDFTGTAPQVGTAINVPMLGTRATVFCVVKTLLDPDLPPNAGVNRVITVSAPEGTLVNPVPPAAVGERGSTCQIIGDVVAAALAPLVPGESAAGCGGQIGYRLCGTDPRTKRYFVEYQMFGGGHGATAFGDGMDTVRAWASGSSNAPVEADEIAYPILVHRYELRDGSGGAGRYRGGLGVRRVFSVYAEDAVISTSATRVRVAPPGINAGGPGAPAEIIVNADTTREQRLGKMVTDYGLASGDVVELRSAGGGGWGNPQERDPAMVERDLREGKDRPAGHTAAEPRRADVAAGGTVG